MPTLPVTIDLPSDSLDRRTPGAALARVEAIAAIHALAEHLAEHPEIPVPYQLSLICNHPDVPRSGMRAWAKRMGYRALGSDDERIGTWASGDLEGFEPLSKVRIAVFGNDS